MCVISLLERDEARRVGRTETGTTVRHGLVGDREFTEVVAGHLGLDLDGDKRLAVVHTADRTDHLGDDDHVAQVGLDGRRLLVGCSLLLGLAKLLDETERLALETALEPPAGTGVDELYEIRGIEILVIRNYPRNLGARCNSRR